LNDLILSLVGTGLSDAEIFEFMSKQKPPIEDPKAIKAAIKTAKQSLQNMAEYRKDFEIGKALFRLNELYKKSMAIQDYKGCLAIQKEINGLLVTSDTRVNKKPEDAL